MKSLEKKTLLLDIQIPVFKEKEVIKEEIKEQTISREEAANNILNEMPMKFIAS